MKTVYKRLLAFLLLLVVASSPFLLGFVAINLAATKDQIRQFAIETFDTDIEIRGALQLRLGLHPRLSAAEISVGSPDDSFSRLVDIEKLEIKLGFLALLTGDIHLSMLEASGVSIDYCPLWLPQVESAQGRNERPSFAVDNLHIENILPHCKQANKQLGFRVTNADLKGVASLDKPMKISVLGTIENEAFELTASSTSLNSLLNSLFDTGLSKPAHIPFSIMLKALSAEAQIDGNIATSLSDPIVAANISLVIDSMNASTNAFGFTALPFEGVEFSSQLRLNQTEINLRQAELTFVHRLGQNRLEFEGSLKHFSTRPLVDVAVRMEQLDLALLNVAGQDAADRSDDWRMSDLSRWFTLMHEFDAQLALTVDAIVGLPLTVQTLTAGAKLDRGKLLIDQLELLLAGSKVQGSGGLNLNAVCPQLDTSLYISGLKLDSVKQAFFPAFDVGGEVRRLVVKSNSCGTSLTEFVETLSVHSVFTDIDYIYQGQQSRLDVNAVSLQFSSQQAGQLIFNGKLEGERVSGEIGFAATNKILSESFWPISFKAEGLDWLLLLNGDAAFIEGQARLQGRLNFDSERIGLLSSKANVVADNLLALKVDSSIGIDQGVLHLSEIDIKLGRSNLGGSFAWSLKEDDAVIVTNLHSSYLDAEELRGLIRNPSDLDNSDSPYNLGRSGAPDFSSKVGVDSWRNLDWMESWFDFPAVDFYFSADEIHNLNFDVEKLTVMGKVSKGVIDHAEMKLIVEEIEMEGFLDMNLLQENWVLDSQFDAHNVDIAKFLSRLDIETEDNIKAETLGFSVTSQGRSVFDLAINAKIESRLDALFWERNEIVGVGTDKLFLSSVEFVTRPTQATRGSGKGTLNGVPVSLFVQTPSIRSVADKDESLPFTLLLSSGEEVIMIDAIISQRNESHPVAELTISGQDLETINGELFAVQSPLADYQLQTVFVAEQDALRFSDIQARVGESVASGQLDIVLRDGKNQFSITATSPYVETNDFVLLLQDLRSLRSQSVDVGDAQVVGAKDLGSFMTLFYQKIEDLAASNVIDVQFDIDELRSNEKLLGRASFGMRMEGEEFQINPFSIDSANGTFEAQYKIKRVDDGVASEFNANIENFEFSELSSLLNPDSTDKGFIYLDASLTSQAPDWASLNSGLQGTFDLAIFPEGISADVLDLWASNLVWAILPALPGTAKEKQINCLAARFEVEGGVMTAQKLLMDTTDIIVHGRGNIDLAKREVDLLFSPQAKLEKYLSVSAPIQIKGPVDDFSARVPQGSFVMTAFRWYMNTIYVPYKWFSGERFPADGIATCYSAMGWQLPPSIE